jgi:hypothetical protein
VGSPNATTADFATDIQAGIEWLRQRNDIRGSSIGLLGHSEGAIIEPIVASEDPRIAFVVMLGGAGGSSRDTVIEQFGKETLAPAALERIVAWTTSQARPASNASRD